MSGVNCTSSSIARCTRKPIAAQAAEHHQDERQPPRRFVLARRGTATIASTASEELDSRVTVISLIAALNSGRPRSTAPIIAGSCAMRLLNRSNTFATVVVNTSTPPQQVDRQVTIDLDLVVRAARRIAGSGAAEPWWWSCPCLWV